MDSLSEEDLEMCCRAWEKAFRDYMADNTDARREFLLAAAYHAVYVMENVDFPVRATLEPPDDQNFVALWDLMVQLIDCREPHQYEGLRTCFHRELWRLHFGG